VVLKATKREYMLTEEDKGLTSFFKRNKDNLVGIFDTCIDRLFCDYDPNKLDTMISMNPAMNNYWMQPSLFYYIQTMEILFASGKYSRQMFLNYMTDEDPDKKDQIANRKAFLCL